MKQQITIGWIVVVIAQICVLSFLFTTLNSLPNSIASHFDRLGRADNFMSRANYLNFMLFFMSVLPLASTLFISALIRFAPTLINLPHKKYWLAPERRAETIAALLAHTTWFGVLLTLFVGVVHGLVLQANAVNPPQLSTLSMLFSILIFIVLTGTWSSWLIVKFFRIPPQ